MWPFIQGRSFNGLPHTYLNIFFSEITGLFDGLFIRLFRSLDQNVYGKNKICSIISCYSWPWPILTLLRRSGERLRTFRSSSLTLVKLNILCTVKPVLSGHSKRRPKIVFKTDYRLMQVKSIAECSNGSILQYFRPSLSHHLSLRSLFCLFLSGYLKQVLLYYTPLQYLSCKPAAFQL